MYWNVTMIIFFCHILLLFLLVSFGLFVCFYLVTIYDSNEEFNIFILFLRTILMTTLDQSQLQNPIMRLIKTRTKKRK